MGAKGKNWNYFRLAQPLRPGQPATKPFLDIFTLDSESPMFYGKDITKSCLALVYNCKPFIEQHPEERADLALRLGDEVHANQATQAQRKEYEKIRAARAARLHEGRERVGEAPATSRLTAGTALSESVWLHGLRAVSGSDLLNYVQRASDADIETFRKLLFRFLVTANLPLSVFDKNDAWTDLLKFISPAFAPYSINRAYISSHRVRRLRCSAFRRLQALNSGVARRSCSTATSRTYTAPWSSASQTPAPAPTRRTCGQTTSTRARWWLAPSCMASPIGRT
jgi:hypothetical protein